MLKLFLLFRLMGWIGLVVVDFWIMWVIILFFGGLGVLCFGFLFLLFLGVFSGWVDIGGWVLVVRFFVVVGIVCNCFLLISLLVMV